MRFFRNLSYRYLVKPILIEQLQSRLKDGFFLPSLLFSNPFMQITSGYCELYKLEMYINISPSPGVVDADLAAGEKGVSTTTHRYRPFVAIDEVSVGD